MNSKMRACIGTVIGPNGIKRNGISLYHVTKFPFSIGDVWSCDEISTKCHHCNFFKEPPPREYIDNPEFMQRREVENIFESIRENEYPKFVGRNGCIFANISVADAEKWIQKSSRMDGKILKVELLEGNCAILDIIWFNYGVRVQKGAVSIENYIFRKSDKISEISEAAKLYWTGKLGTEFGYESKLEALLKGKVFIKKLVN